MFRVAFCNIMYNATFLRTTKIHPELVKSFG